MSARERLVRWEPGYDHIRFECPHGSPRCYPGSGGSHGVHGMAVRFVLRVQGEGAVNFVVFLGGGWLPEPEERVRFWELRLNEARGMVCTLQPMAADLGYHALAPQYEGQEPMGDGECDLLGVPCYYDGSSLNAREPFRILCSFGEEALWRFLDGYYDATFHGGAYPKGEEWPHKRRVPAQEREP